MKFITQFGLVFWALSIFAGEENFLLMDATTNTVIHELGPHIHERMSPGSTFKMALSLMGYEMGILEDEWTPIWGYHEGYVAYRESWKTSQSPRSWMKNSCIWYSQILAPKLGLEMIQNYLALFEYGNQDMSGGITTAWLGSSLKISPAEQVRFIQKIIQERFPLSSQATEMTKRILFVEELPDGSKLFGKTGLFDQEEENLEVGWFIGWVEKEEKYFPFAYQIRAEHINPENRIPRTKQLIAFEQQ
jgi:beta-lactamase class D